MRRYKISFVEGVYFKLEYTPFILLLNMLRKDLVDNQSSLGFANLF